MKTKTRILSEKIQSFSGRPLIEIHVQAMNFVSLGICKDREEALQYILSLYKGAR